MNTPSLFKYIDEEASTFIDFLIDITNIESPSNDKTGVDAVASAIETFAAGRGLIVKRTPFQRSGDGLVVETAERAGRKPVVFIAHMDTVHVHGAFGSPPVQKQDQILTGPGIHDCKGGIAVALLAMDTLIQNGYQDRQLRLVLVPDEEVSSAYSGPEGIDFIRQNVRDAAYAFCCESGNRNGDVAVGRKGILKLDVTVTGKAAHAGSAYRQGISAIKEAAHKIISLEKFDQHENVTINCGVINGGTKPNIVPQSCTFTLDVRFLQTEEKEAALLFIEEIINHAFIPGTTASYQIISERIPMAMTPDNLKLCDYLNEMCDEYHLTRLNPMVSGGGADSAYAVQEGVPTVCSLGIVGQYQHTLNEQADIPSLAERAKLLAAAITGNNPFDA